MRHSVVVLLVEVEILEARLAMMVEEEPEGEELALGVGSLSLE